MKRKSQKQIFVPITPEQAATVNGGAYWTQNRNRGGDGVSGGSGGGGSSSSDSP